MFNSIKNHNQSINLIVTAAYLTKRENANVLQVEFNPKVGN